ncbi:hypothetical protein CLD22_22045 [Rubrivivax gelatinosus]|nr:hypothetical protein [Rubrivivax gelatinosus]
MTPELPDLAWRERGHAGPRPIAAANAGCVADVAARSTTTETAVAGVLAAGLARSTPLRHRQALRWN